MNGKKIVALVALMLLLVSLPANAAVTATTVEVRGTVANATALSGNNDGVSWNYENFAGFWYDLKENKSSETMEVLKFSGERSIEMAFHVQHVLQAHIVTAQGSMADMLDPDDRDAIQKSESMDESMQSKYGGQIRRIQGDVLSNLKPDEMFKLVKMLFEQVIINGENGVKALGSHFAKNKSHILPVLKEVIRVNDFLDLDMTALL